MRLGFTNKTENKNYLTEILQLPDLLPVLLIILISVCLAIIATYYSYTYLLAILLFVVAIIVFLKSPEWFFYFFAFFRISLDAIKLFSYFVPEIGRRWGLSLDGVITLLLLLCAVIYFTTRKNIDIFGLPGSRAYFIFLIIGLISLIFSLDKIVGIRRLIHYATYFLIYILGVNILNTKEKNYKMAYSIVFSSFIPLFVGFYQAVTGRGSLTSTGFNRIFATVSYPNAYAFYLMIILIFILTMYFYVGDIRKKLLLFLISIPMAISLILTYTRGAWVGFCFGAGILMLMLLRKLSVRNFVLLVVFLIGIAVLISLFTAHITARSSYLAGAKMGSFGWRGMVWSINFDEFLNHPFRGFGIGSCGAIAKRRLGFIIAPHNEYLKLMVETGIFGVISYVTALVLLLRFSMRKYRENLGTKKGILASGLAAAIFSVMVVAFGDNLFDYDAVFSYFWFFVVVGYNLLRES